MKRIFALLLSLAVLFSCLAVTAGAMFDPSTVYDVKAQSAYIVNTDTDIIVYEKDSEKQVSAGGLTKYMTIALVLTNYADQLDSTFTMPFAISDYVHNSDNADMRSGETFTYREALYAMVMRNANEAAMGLAYELSGGDLAGWVSQMNTLSQRIGTTNSTWTDACGLDSGNTTTAVDMYLILRPSCYHCPAKGASRVSDLTLADFWGIQNVDPTMFDDKGTSLVLVHSAAGEQALAQIRSDLLLKAEPLESALAGNPSAVHSATEPKARAAFFAEFEKRQGDLDYRRAADKYCLFYGKSVKQKAVACAKKLLRRG